METQHCGFARDDVEGVVAGNLVLLRQLHFKLLVPGTELFHFPLTLPSFD
jgi:hypothetical protein